MSFISSNGGLVGEGRWLQGAGLGTLGRKVGYAMEDIGYMAKEYQAILAGSGMPDEVAEFLGINFDHGYRPSTWPYGSQETLVYCKTNIGGLFFDAVLSSDTEHTAVITQHPVQSGANISDHMYMEPVRISMEIGMSDVMASMVEGQWTGAYTKSVSAYRKLCELQSLRIPFRVQTRLNAYDNMVIQSISVHDDVNTLYGLRASVSMVQIIMADVVNEKVSARGWSSGNGTNRGEVQPQVIPTSTAGSIEGQTVNGNDTGREIKT